MMHMYNTGWWFHPGWIFQILIFLAFFFIVWWLVKSGGVRREDPKGILKRRLAKGEITKKEYEDLKKEIE